MRGVIRRGGWDGIKSTLARSGNDPTRILHIGDGHRPLARPAQAGIIVRMSEQTDILVIGGGLVGTSLAIALDAAGLDATLVEASPPRAAGGSSYGERNLALARATVNGLRAIGVWSHAEAGATPIRHIHVSRAGDFGSTRIDARAMGLDAVGWTLPARELGLALQARLASCERLQLRVPARLQRLERNEDGWVAQVEAEGDTRVINARLLVGADGTGSAVRNALGMGTDEYDYAQTLFVCTVTPSRAPEGRAFERFSDEGPVALLPLAGDRAGLVLTVAAAQAEAVSALDDAAFIALAQRRFGWRLGRLQRPGKRHPYPIRRVAADRVTGPRAVLVGNAAQTIHPIGAQGFNLGLRDALTLAEMVADHEDPGAPGLLEAYAARRAPDRDGVMAMSHGLVRLACLAQPELSPLRSLGLLAVSALPLLHQQVALHGMGFRGRPPQAVLEATP
jgi:2-octaprenyl-6-methoxyphenol hydroxylase